MKEIRSHVLVKGNVQGVFFRVNTVERANEHNVTGWVKNLPDGGMEAVLEGKNKDVQKVIEWIKIGPLDAKIDNVEIYDEEYTGEFENFNIKYD